MLKAWLYQSVFTSSVLIYLVFFIGCGGPTLTKANISNDFSRIFKENNDSANIVDADIMLSVQGEKHSANFTAIIKDSVFKEFKIYSPFIGDLVSLKSTKDSLFLNYEKAKFAVLKSDGLKKLPFFSNYPFNFNMFVRILTGKLPFTSEEILKNGKIYENESGSIIRLEIEDFYLKMIINKHKLKKSSVEMTTVDTGEWKLKYNNFKENGYKKISFNDNKGNGFVLSFKN